MSDDRVFDVVLFGYRNDLARAQTLDFLRQLPASESGPLTLDDGSGVPQRLFAALDPEGAERVRAELERLGAQVALVPAGEQTTRHAALPVSSSERRRSAWRLAPALVLLAAVAGIHFHSSLPLVHSVRPVAHARAPVPRITAALEHVPVGNARREPDETARLNSEAIAVAEAGSFAEAVDRLQRALQLTPDDPVLVRNLQTVLLQWGIADLTANRLGDASDHLEEAARFGDLPDVLQAQAVIAVREARLADAAALLERALRIAPADKNLLLMLGQVYFQKDKRPEALEMLQRAKEAGARGPDLDTLVQQLSREVDTEWDFVELDSPHFHISFADDEDRHTVRFVLSALEDARDLVDAKFGYHSTERTPVVLYTQRDFHAVTQTPDWAGGAYDGRIEIPVRGLSEDDPSLIRVARHEYAHSVIAQLSGGHCPVWLNEGLAVWAEEDQEGDHEAAAQRVIEAQELFSLADLNRPFAAFSQARAGVAYAESYLAVRYLIDSYSSRSISVLLRALKGTPKLADAFAAVYPDDLAGFEEGLLRQLAGS